MPKIANDYSKVVIYKLVHKDDRNDENIYIGSTTDFIRRKHTHKSSCYNQNNRAYIHKKYEYIRNNGGWKEWLMLEIEKYPCNDHNEANAREEYWRRTLTPNLNALKCHRTPEDNDEYGKKYYEDNKEEIAKKYKIYRDENIDKINEQRQGYRDTHKVEKAEADKKYRENNVEKVKDMKKKYYDDNKEKLAEKDAIKVQCPICGTLGAKNKLKRHQETVKCQSFLKSIPLVE